MSLCQERERIRKDFPDHADFKDEEYLKELLAKSEEDVVSDEDSIPSALNRQNNRRKFYYVCNENETSQDDGITTTTGQLQRWPLQPCYSMNIILLDNAIKKWSVNHDRQLSRGSYHFRELDWERNTRNQRLIKAAEKVNLSLRGSTANLLSIAYLILG